MAAKTTKKVVVKVDGNVKNFNVAMGSAAESTKRLHKETQKLHGSGKVLSDSFQKMANSAHVLHGPLNGISGRLSGLATSFRIMSVSAVAAGAGLTALAAGMSKGLAVAIEAEHQYKRLEAVLNVTGHAAGFTAENLETFSRDLARATLASTDGVRAAAASLATFTNISGAMFKDTLKISQDIAEVMGTDIKAAALQMAKALDSPTQGMASLRRAGVSFTIAQQEVIKSLEETGRLFEAQDLVMQAVKDQVEGVAEAVASDSVVGAWDTLGQEVDEFWEASVKVIGAIPAVQAGLTALGNVVRDFKEDLDPSYIKDDDLTVRIAKLQKLYTDLESGKYATGRGSPAKGQSADDIFKKLIRLQAEQLRRDHAYYDDRQAIADAYAKRQHKINEQRAAAEISAKKEAAKDIEKMQRQIETAQVGASESATHKARIKFLTVQDQRLREYLAALEKHKASNDSIAALAQKYHDAEMARLAEWAVNKEKAFQQDSDASDKAAAKIKRKNDKELAAAAKIAAAKDKLDDEARRKAEKFARLIERLNRQQDALQKKIGGGEGSTAVQDEEAKFEAVQRRFEREKAATLAANEDKLAVQEKFDAIELLNAELHELDMQEARKEDAETLREDNAERRAAIDEFAAYEQQVLNARTKLATDYVNAMGSTFGTLATLLEEGSKAQQVALVAEKAAATTSAALNFNKALMIALADTGGFPANMAAYGAVAAMGATLLSNLAGLSVSGRASGGRVSPGGRYMVGEHGPELLTLGMTNGQITKAEDVSPNVNVTIIEDAERAGQVQQEGDNVQVYVAAAMQHLQSEFNSGRGLFGQIEAKYNLVR